jgi:general nucleoside transport system permease protein
MQRIRRGLRSARIPALSLLTAFLLGAIGIVLTDVEHLRRFGSDPLGALGGALGGVANGYAAMLTGAIGNPSRILAALQHGSPDDIAAAVRPISESLVSATPFIFAGLGVAVSFRAGLFNLGVDGQFLIGGLGASIAAGLVAGRLPPLPALAVAVAGGTIAGGAYAFIPGFLKARTGAHEVITTVMLNGIAPNLAFLVAGWIGLSGTPPIPAVPRLTDLPMIRVDYGFMVALVMAGAVSWLLFHTTIGFELRTAGLGRSAAGVAGMRPDRAVVLAMTLSGALVGMGSAFFGLGPAWGSPGMPEAGMGYVAIALALLGGSRPGGVVAAALLYGALTNGAENAVVATGIPLALLTVIVALTILLAAAPELTRSIWRMRAPTAAADPDADTAPRPSDPV